MGAPGPLEPGMLVGGVVDGEFDHHPNAAGVGGLDEVAEVVEGAVGRVVGAVVGDVVAVVLERLRVERQQPERGDAEVGDVVEL